jgi:hypothetical protein
MTISINTTAPSFRQLGSYHGAPNLINNTNHLSEKLASLWTKKESLNDTASHNSIVTELFSKSAVVTDLKGMKLDEINHRLSIGKVASLIQ